MLMLRHLGLQFATVCNCWPVGTVMISAHVLLLKSNSCLLAGMIMTVNFRKAMLKGSRPSTRLCLGHVVSHLVKRKSIKTAHQIVVRNMTTDAEDANLAARGFHRYTSKKYEKVGGVLEFEWVQSLMQQKDTSSVLTAGAMVSKDSLLPIDHMVRCDCSVEALPH